VDGGALVDGYLMLICGAAVGEGKHTVVPATAPPALWVNSELEGRNVPGPDSTEFRIWEVAGSSHVGNYAMTQSAATIARDGGSVGGSRTAGIGWDEDAQRQYGEHAGRPCLNRFPLHYAMMAAAEALPTWIMTGRAPESARYERNGSELVRDGDGNMRGGVRLPPIDVPVATSAGADCPVAIMGSTDRFDPLTLARRYPSHDDYVRKMAAATSTALARGWMLEPEATELMRLAEAAPIPGPSALAVATPGTSGHR
ncbi:MAG: alpha/beta hydrolase domain-containing protein, partial [Acidimicrobiia bacterium]